MSGFDTAAVEYHLRRLDGDDLAAFVRDLWASRGYDATREGNAVIATHGPETVRIWVPSAADGTARRAPDRQVDIVVAPDGYHGHHGRHGHHGGTRVVDAATLREMLEYAVDRSVARDLCERHLGALPEALGPPPLSRAKHRAGSVLGQLTPALLPGTLVVLLGLGAVAGTVVLSDPAGPAAVPAGGESTPAVSTPVSVRSADAGGQTDTKSEVSRPVDEPPFPSSSGTPPPGVSRDGITDVGELATAHEHTMANRSHTVWVDRHRPRGLIPNRTRIKRDIDMAVEDGRYLISVTEVEPDTRKRLGEVYFDGVSRYAAVYNETSESYGRVFILGSQDDLSTTPVTIRGTVVWRYLSTPRTTVTGRTTRDGTTIYRIVGTGPPTTSSLRNVRNYTVVARVDARGFVRELAAEYDRPTSNRTARVRHEVEYGGIGTTSVDPPAWYERLNGTGRPSD